MQLKAIIALLLVTTPLSAIDYTITTIAGSGTQGFGGDGGDARCASLNRPTGVDVDARGFVYIADYSNHRVRRVSPEGTITTIAGTGVAGFSGDGGPAVSAQLAGPYGVRVIEDGVLIADAQNGRIRHIDAAGTIRTIAGGGSGESSGDGGRATDARLQHPVDVIRLRDGSLLIAEGGGNRVRRVSADGIIETFAGSGKRRYNGQGYLSGDGGPAREATLNVPASLAIDRDGTVYIGDLRNHVVRRVSPDGTIATVAGTGARGQAGDGGPAVQAELEEPGGLLFEPDGHLLIAELTRIRRMTGDGRLVTIAGSGKRGFSGDFGPAASSEFAVLDLMTIDGNGNIFVADHRNNRIRKLTPVRAAHASSASRTPSSADVERLLSAMRNAYSSIESAELSFLLTRGTHVTRGTLRYAKPSTVGVTLDVPEYGRVEIEGDATSIQVRDPMLPRPETLPWTLQNARTAIGANLEVISLWDWARQLSTAEGGNMTGSDLSLGSPQTWRGRRWTVLEERSGSTVYQYFIDPRTFLIWRTLVKDNGPVLYDGTIETLKVE